MVNEYDDKAQFREPEPTGPKDISEVARNQSWTKHETNSKGKTVTENKGKQFWWFILCISVPDFVIVLAVL